MRYKKGSHVGIMISFMIIIVFVIFIYSAIEPAIKSEDNKDLFLNNIEKSLINSFEDNLSIDIIKVSTSLSCIEIPILGINKEYIAKNEKGEVLNTDLSTNNIFVELNNNDYIKVYSSNWFNNSAVFSSGSCETSYTGFEITKKGIFKNKIKELIKHYNNDYELIKSDLDVSEELDFKFDFILENKTEILTNKEIISENIYSKEFFINYFDENANSKLGKIRLNVWRSY